MTVSFKKIIFSIIKCNFWFFFFLNSASPNNGNVFLHVAYAAIISIS